MKRQNQNMLQGPLLKNIILYTVPIILTSWLQLLFNAADFAQAGADLAAMFGFAHLPLYTPHTGYLLGSFGILFLAGFVGATPLMKNIGLRLRSTRAGKILEIALYVALLLICTAYLVDGSFSPFLYFRF